jgi:hypothetical protein
MAVNFGNIALLKRDGYEPMREAAMAGFAKSWRRE